ncbi:Rap1a/Tai family immunity protein [Cronobacter sakazakii]
MGKLAYSAVASMLLLFSISAYSKFYDGQYLYRYAQEYKKAEYGDKRTPDNQLQAGVFIGYITSIIDSYGSEGARVFCQPNGRLQTYADVIFKYLSDHPERRIHSADELVIEAMQNSYRCN